MKASEIENLSLEDLQDKLADYQKQLLDLKMNHAVSPLENPLQIKMARRRRCGSEKAPRHGQSDGRSKEGGEQGGTKIGGKGFGQTRNPTRKSRATHVGLRVECGGVRTDSSASRARAARVDSRVECDGERTDSRASGTCS